MSTEVMLLNVRGRSNVRGVYCTTTTTPTSTATTTTHSRRSINDSAHSRLRRRRTANKATAKAANRGFAQQPQITDYRHPVILIPPPLINLLFHTF